MQFQVVFFDRLPEQLVAFFRNGIEDDLAFQLIQMRSDFADDLFQFAAVTADKNSIDSAPTDAPPETPST